MAHINVNQQIVTNLKNDDITAMLNQIIDDELSKDVSVMDTKLIDDCVDALLAIESEDNDKFAVLIPLMSSDRFLRKISGSKISFKNLNIFARVAVVAAIIAGSTLTANAAVQAITGVNILSDVGDAIEDKLEDLGIKKTGIDLIEGEDDDDEVFAPAVTTTVTTTEESTTQNVIQVTNAPTTVTTTVASTTKNETTTHKGIEVIDGEDDDDETTTTTTTKPSTTRKTVKDTTATPATEPDVKEPVYFVGVKAHFDNFKTDYIYGETLSYDGLTLTKVYSDGSEENLPLSDCDYTQAVDMNKTQDVTLKILYDSCSVKIDITIRPDEETRGSIIRSTDDYDYLLTGKGAYITAYKGNSKNIVLDYIDEDIVYAVCANVFKDSDVENVYLDNVVKIFDNAFENCTNLIDCYTPRAEYIGSKAFKGCTNMSEALFSDKLSYLGTAAYQETAITKLTLPDGITEIPNHLCDNCTALKTVNFNGDVTKIGEYAFSECEALESVTGTSKIKTVGEFAFYYDESVDFDEFPSKLEQADDCAFQNCRNLDIGELPKTLQKFGEFSFANCTKLTGVTIPVGTTIIPNSAFRATGIKELIIPDGVKEIQDYAFMSTKLKEITLPESLVTIGKQGLYSITLRKVTFGSKINKIGENAFYAGRSVKFYVYENTAAHTYAKEHSIAYELLDPKDEKIEVIVGEDD